MRVHLVGMHPGALVAMKDHAELANPQLHELTESPELADVILFVGALDPNDFSALEASSFPRRFPEKCFAYYDSDGFVPLLPGVYTNAVMPRFLSLKRAESGPFIDTINPYTVPMPSDKEYLFSFVGGSTSLLRKRLYRIGWQREDIRVENTSAYHHWDPEQDGRDARQRAYATVVSQSRFALCPRGASAGSLRLFEVMQMGVAPVLISDRYQLPAGPEWGQFLIRVPERDIKRLPELLERLKDSSEERGALAREAWLAWFAPESIFNGVVSSCQRIRAARRVPEAKLRPLWKWMILRNTSSRGARQGVRALLLWLLDRLHLRDFANLNR